MGITKLRPPPDCVIPYQAFEAAGFEQDLSRNEIKGTMWDHSTLTRTIGSGLQRLGAKSQQSGIYLSGYIVDHSINFPYKWPYKVLYTFKIIDFNLTLRAQMYWCFFSLTRNTLPNFPFPRGFPMSKSSSVSFLHIFTDIAPLQGLTLKCINPVQRWVLNNSVNVHLYLAG